MRKCNAPWLLKNIKLKVLFMGHYLELMMVFGNEEDIFWRGYLIQKLWKIIIERHLEKSS